MAYLAVPVAAFFFAMGFVALAAPGRILTSFGVDVRTADGRTEVRAMYGGFGVAIGGLLLAAIAAALIGMAGGSLVSATIGGKLSVWPVWTFFVVELVLAGLLVLATR